MKLMVKAFITFLFLASVQEVHSQLLQREVDIIMMTRFNKCEGKDSGNYTRIATETIRAPFCNAVNLKTISHQMIDNTPGSEKSTINLHPLVSSRYPQGAYFLVDYLTLAVSGSLQGKFIYIRISGLSPAFVIGCNALLGWSMISSKNAQLVISDKMDLNVFISPTDALEQFKKNSTTICRGEAITV